MKVTFTTTNIPFVFVNFFDNFRTSHEYHLFYYCRAKDADHMIILMGSATDAARETIDNLNARS